MQKDNKFFDDMARMAAGMAGGALDMKREIEAAVAARMDAWLARHGIAAVSREEFEIVKEMAQKARQENEALKERLAALEAGAKSGK